LNASKRITEYRHIGNRQYCYKESQSPNRFPDKNKKKDNAAYQSYCQ
jgi:hypothetical protein